MLLHWLKSLFTRTELPRSQRLTKADRPRAITPTDVYDGPFHYALRSDGDYVTRRLSIEELLLIEYERLIARRKRR